MRDSHIESAELRPRNLQEQLVRLAEIRNALLSSPFYGQQVAIDLIEASREVLLQALDRQLQPNHKSDFVTATRYIQDAINIIAEERQ